MAKNKLERLPPSTIIAEATQFRDDLTARGYSDFDALTVAIYVVDTIFPAYYDQVAKEYSL